MNKKIINILIFIFALLFILLFCEIFLRIFYQQPTLRRSYVESSPMIFQNDDKIPWKLKPMATDRHLNIFDEWNVSVEINSLGLRDNLPPQNLSIKKILILGDSFTFGYGVEQNESYPEVLEKLLGGNYVVINSGYADGYSPDTEYVYLNYEGLNFDPDIIIMGFFIGNDITDLRNNKWLKLDDNDLPLKISSDIYHVDDDNRLRFKDDDKIVKGKYPPILYKINNFLNYNSHFYILFKNELKYTLNLFKEQDVSLVESIYKNDSDLESFWIKDEDILNKINLISKSKNKTFIVVLIPSIDQVKNKQIDNYNFTIPNDRIMDFGNRHNLTVIDLLPYFSQQDNPKKFYYKFDPHWNSKGHKFAAEIIYKKLEDLKIV